MRGKAAKVILIATGMLMLALLAVPHHHHHHGYSICFATSQACDRCADPTHARSQDVDNCHQIFVMSGRDDQSHIEPIPPIAPDFRDCLLPYIRRSGRFGPATFLSAFHGTLRLAWQRAFALVTGSSRFPGLTRLFPFQENGLFIRR